jgi:glycosyltransferase involved in cell wall biosynthesis
VTKVYLYPEFNTPDAGDGGVRRVVEAQRLHCPRYGVEFVDDPADAEVIAAHIQIPEEYLRRFPDKAIVTHVHGFYWDEYKGADGKSLWERWSLQANLDVMKATLVADIVTSPSEWVSQAIRRHTCRDVRTVRHGINLEEWDVHEPERSKYVLWNKSRPDPVCDPEPVYKVAALLPQVEFISTFGGWSLSIPPINVKLTGRVPHEQARRLVEGADVYLATTRETYGIGTLEAMAAGVPVVGWKWGGQREFIEHGVDGWLAQPHDIEGLAEGIAWARANRPTVSKAARAKAEQYTWDEPARMYAEIYAEAAERKARVRPKVSVIVTAYKLDKYLDWALASVLKQDDTFKDWECIIVDDASPDRCGEIADAWARRDPRFRVLHNEKNLYLAGARNAGLAISRGDYIMPLDADDMLAEATLQILSEALDADRRTHVAYGGVFFLDEDGVTPTDYGNERGPGWSGWPSDFRVDWQLRAPNPGQRPNNLLPYASMIRREALELTGGWRERRRTAEDADLWCRLSSYGFEPRRVTGAMTLLYRNRTDSMSQTNVPDDWTMWYPWSRLPDLIPAGAMMGETNNTLAVSSCDPAIIAVIIPVGPGHELLVKDAVDSVDCQTFRQFECIVINDTGHPLTGIPTWVRIIDLPTEDRHGKHYGPAIARNIGIAAATARLYIPLDADDMLRPHALRMMFAAFMAEADGKAVIYSDFWEDPNQEGEFSVYELPNFESQMLGDHMLGCVTQLTPVSAWRDVGGYDEEIPAWEDWDFQIKLCEAGYCMKHLAQPLWTYRKHTGYRRDVQYVNRDEPGGAKDMIIARYPDIWPEVARSRGIELKGRSPLMGCASCGGGGGGGAAQIQNIIMANQFPRALNPTATGAMLVQYIGDRRGAVEYRAKTDAVYKFDAGEEPIYVHPDDLELFRMRDDFRIIEGSEAVLPPSSDVFAPPQSIDGPQGNELDENNAELVEKKKRTRAKAGELPAGVTLE